jgi:hypothetical protein
MSLAREQLQLLREMTEEMLEHHEEMAAVARLGVI